MGCSVFECKNNSEECDPLTKMYGFPKHEALRLAWIAACANPNDSLESSQPNLVVCEEHFADEDFVAGTERKGLKFGSLPTLNLPDNAYESFPRTKSTSGDNPDAAYANNMPSRLQEARMQLKSSASFATSSEHRELNDLKLKVNRLSTQLAIFYKMFTPAQIERIFNPKKGPGNGFPKSTVERSVERYEIDHLGKKPPTRPEDEMFTDVIESEDADAIERFVAQQQVIVTRLKTN